MTTPAPLDIPKNTVPIRLPVAVVEGLETADGRFIVPGALTIRSLPISVYAQDKSSHGSLDGDTSTWLVGAITKADRIPGPEVTQLSTGQPFPEGTFVWDMSGWMYRDVPAPPSKAAFELVRDGALRGNSVDLSAVEAEFEYADDGEPIGPDTAPDRIVMLDAVIAATTLVGQPAFPDAYVELDGQAMAMAEPPALAAAATPLWRSSETGDVCSPCLAGADEDEPLTAALFEGDDFDAPAVPQHTGGMIALVPANPRMLAAPGGDPAEELHLTLAYLGDDVVSWDQRARDAVRDAVVSLAVGDDSGEEPAYGPLGPLTGNVFSHAVFNPNGDNGHDPATVYLFDGQADRDRIEALAYAARERTRRAVGDVFFPEQHSPFVPHVTAGYGLDPNLLTYTGPVQFDVLRLAFGDDIQDFPLPGAGDSLVAAAAPTGFPPVSIFQNPQLTEPTPPTVLPDGTAYGHLACWGTCHIGFNGKCVTPPKSRTAYAYFMVHSTRALDDNGQVVTVPVGYGTIGTGHADMRASAMATAEHYDNTGTAAFEYAVGEDAHGIWFAGRLMPGLTEDQEHRARGTVFSGDWRMIRGNLELVASLGVNTPGFPVPRPAARVASGEPVAMVAAGLLHRPDPVQVSEETLAQISAQAPDPAVFQEILAFVRQSMHGQAVTDALAEIDTLTVSSVFRELDKALADMGEE